MPKKKNKPLKKTQRLDEPAKTNQETVNEASPDYGGIENATQKENQEE